MKEVNGNQGLTVTDFKHCHKATVIKTVWYRHQDRQVDENKHTQIESTDF